MKIYLASSWRNASQATVLAALREHHEVYDFKNPKPGNTGFGWRQTIDRPILDAIDLSEALAHPRAIEGFGFDFAAMKWADACVLLLPCGNSAHLEAGWFSGMGKPVVVLIPELREPELMYKCFDDVHGFTPLFSTVDNVLEHLADITARGAFRCPKCLYVAPSIHGCSRCNPEQLAADIEKTREELQQTKDELQDLRDALKSSTGGPTP